MTLRELTAELDKITQAVQSVRRADLDIPGDPVRAMAIRQHIVLCLEDVRKAIDDLSCALDNVGDMDRLMARREGITARVLKALGPGE